MKKDIKDLAEAFADHIDDGCRTARQCAILAYKAGYEAPHASVWHRVDEIPTDPTRAITIVTAKRKRFKNTTYNTDAEWLRVCRQVGAFRWAYKNDVLGL